MNNETKALWINIICDNTLVLCNNPSSSYRHLTTSFLSNCYVHHKNKHLFSEQIGMWLIWWNISLKSIQCALQKSWLFYNGAKFMSNLQTAVGRKIQGAFVSPLPSTIYNDPGAYHKGDHSETSNPSHAGFRSDHMLKGLRQPSDRSWVSHEVCPVSYHHYKAGRCDIFLTRA